MIGGRSAEAAHPYGVWIDVLRALQSDLIPNGAGQHLALLRPDLRAAPLAPTERAQLSSTPFLHCSDTSPGRPQWRLCSTMCSGSTKPPPPCCTISPGSQTRPDRGPHGTLPRSLPRALDSQLLVGRRRRILRIRGTGRRKRKIGPTRGGGEVRSHMASRRSGGTKLMDLTSSINGGTARERDTGSASQALVTMSEDDLSVCCGLARRHNRGGLGSSARCASGLLRFGAYGVA